MRVLGVRAGVGSVTIVEAWDVPQAPGARTRTRDRIRAQARRWATIVRAARAAALRQAKMARGSR